MTASDIYIVRHGNTFRADETPRRVGGRTDLPLTAEGENQARRLGAFFAKCGLRFRLMVASPLKRTMRTAQLISEAVEGDAGQTLAPEPAEWLREIDYGEDEDQPEAIVRARIGPAALAAWEERAVPPPGWRVDVAGLTAAWRRFYEIAAFAGPGGPIGSEPRERQGGGERAKGAPALIVTSNGVARFALRALDAPVTVAADGPADGATSLTSMKLKTGAFGIIRATLRSTDPAGRPAQTVSADGVGSSVTTGITSGVAATLIGWNQRP